VVQPDTRSRTGSSARGGVIVARPGIDTSPITGRPRSAKPLLPVGCDANENRDAIDERATGFQHLSTYHFVAISEPTGRKETTTSV